MELAVEIAKALMKRPAPEHRLCVTEESLGHQPPAGWGERRPAVDDPIRYIDCEPITVDDVDLRICRENVRGVMHRTGEVKIVAIEPTNDIAGHVGEAPVEGITLTLVPLAAPEREVRRIP